VKTLFENWRKYLTEKQEIQSKEELIKFLEENPSEISPTKINIDYPKGTLKKFGGADETTLPFDYGELTALINPADKQGWDIIIANNSSSNSQNLKPVGHAEYSSGAGNDKIIVADGGNLSSGEKQEIAEFFSERGSFKDVEWY
jgi:hypothetical protein